MRTTDILCPISGDSGEAVEVGNRALEDLAKSVGQVSARMADQVFPTVDLTNRYSQEIGQFSLAQVLSEAKPAQALQSKLTFHVGGFPSPVILLGRILCVHCVDV